MASIDKSQSENEYGVKTGDLFCADGSMKHFFQVVEVKSQKRVVVREIETVKGEANKDGYHVERIPKKDKFKAENDWLKDNEKGEVKIVQKDENGAIFIRVKAGSSNYRETCSLWHGEKVEDDCWNIWVR